MREQEANSMADEIEKKFLLKKEPHHLMVNGVRMAQGYMINQRDITTRVRMAGEKAFLTIKGRTVKAARKEYEYPVTVTDAQEMLDRFCEKPLIEKTRYYIEYSGFVWEVDVFSGENQGLVVAEIELSHADQAFDMPEWVGEEVTHDPRYYNANLVKHPFSQW